jgi:hypothetical protein
MVYVTCAALLYRTRAQRSRANFPSQSFIFPVIHKQKQKKNKTKKKLDRAFHCRVVPLVLAVLLFFFLVSAN